MGLRWPIADVPRRVAYAAVGCVAAVAAGLAVAGLVTGGGGEGGLRLRVVRLLVGTALGEELVHRGVLVAVWSSTRLRGRWLVVASMVTFGAWHAAGAVHPDGFKLAEVVGPGLVAVAFLWGRLRFRSVIVPAALHAGVNLPGIVLARP